METKPPSKATDTVGVLPWLRGVLREFGTYVAALTAVLAALVALLVPLNELIEYPHGRLLGLLVAGTLITAVLFKSVPDHLRRRRERRLDDEGLKGRLKDPDYFRLYPYSDSPADIKRYSRPDNVHDEVFNWIVASEEPLLYLTGRSGCGKSSLLQASVLPRLRKRSPATRTLMVRGYEDPVGELVRSLLRPDAVWSRPPVNETDPRALLERACTYLAKRKERLLVVFDQFEEFTILRERNFSLRRSLERLVSSLVTTPIPGFKALIVFRSYGSELVERNLPSPRLDANWRVVGPFTRADARHFLAQAPGVRLGDKLLDAIMDEAAELEEEERLVRPITVNFLGTALKRRLGADLSIDVGKKRPGTMLREHLEECIFAADVRDHAPTVLRFMTIDTGNKHSHAIDDLAENTGFSRNCVRAVLIRLGNDGLVRPLDKDQEVWEVSHDFVARQIALLLGKWPGTWFERARSTLAYASLSIWVLAAIGISWFPQWQARQAIQDLRDLGAIVVTDERGDIVSLDSDPRVVELAFKKLDARMRALRTLRLRRFAGAELFSRVAELDHLQTLDLSFCEGLTDEGLRHIARLDKLRNLDLSNCDGLTDEGLRHLADLDQLRTLDLRNCRRLRGSGVSDLRQANPGLQILLSDRADAPQ